MDGGNATRVEGCDAAWREQWGTGETEHGRVSTGRGGEAVGSNLQPFARGARQATVGVGRRRLLGPVVRRAERTNGLWAGQWRRRLGAAARDRHCRMRAYKHELVGTSHGGGREAGRKEEEKHVVGTKEGIKSRVEAKGGFAPAVATLEKLLALHEDQRPRRARNDESRGPVGGVGGGALGDRASCDDGRRCSESEGCRPLS